MDADTLFERRFLLAGAGPSQSLSPSTAPRKSPVFTASVFSTAAVRILCPLAASSPAVHRFLAPIAPIIPGQLGRLPIEGYSPCYGCGFRRAPSLSEKDGAAYFSPDWRVLGEQDTPAEYN